MRFMFNLCAVLLLLSGLVFAQTTEQQDEENVRGAFLTSRPKDKPAQSSPSPGPIRRPPKPRPPGPGPKPSPTPVASVSVGAKVTLRNIGLGLTLFTRDANGLAVRVDPSHEFHKGDRVRVLLESNADGYLYIFNTTDNGQPVMIYPSPELDLGGNYLRSHVPFEIPASAATEERLRWFTFDQYAGTERLYFVFTRDPLPGVPIEDDLITYCRTNEKACPWRPSTQLWTELRNQMNAPLKTDKTQKYGRAQTEVEKDGATRGIGLSQQDPEPSVIMMATVTGTNSLVTVLDLVHK